MHLRDDELSLLTPAIRRAFDKNALVLRACIARVEDLRGADIPVLLMFFSKRILAQLCELAPGNEVLQIALAQTEDSMQLYREQDFDLLSKRFSDGPFEEEGEEPGDQGSGPTGSDSGFADSGTEAPSPESEPSSPSRLAHQPISLGIARIASGGAEAAPPPMVVSDPVTPPVEG